MSLLSDNMRYLRARMGMSQQAVADQLVITRGRYAKYEDGMAEPPIELLVKISRYFHVSIDLLVSVDIRRVPIRELQQLPDNRILLPVAVDAEGKNKIEIIPHKAQMGYLMGYSDPEYIESLQHISLPFLSHAKYRAFPATGDSMPPHSEGSFIIGKYVERKDDLKEGKTYVFITRHEGISYKRLGKKKRNSLLLSSDNPFYMPYEVDLADLLEVWEFACSIATSEAQPDDLRPQTIREMFTELRREIVNLKRG
ncbi:MAG: LexA family transcriptional regulator [Leadbetterella sp.]|nr:LexA family transcriptional regulator [Leadbetterella sp.]